jgi:hypothetical protein
MRDLALAGLGLAMLPGFVVAPEIEAGRLVPVLPGYPDARPADPCALAAGRADARQAARDGRSPGNSPSQSATAPAALQAPCRGRPVSRIAAVHRQARTGLWSPVGPRRGPGSPPRGCT